jgi:hypothetical protein
MSRRFGRNQRRKMREEIALQAMLLRQTRSSLESERAGRLKEKRKRLDLEEEMIKWAERISALLGPKSAFARDLHVMEVDSQLFDAVVYGGLPMRGAPRITRSPGPSRMATDEACRLVDLFATTAVPEPQGHRWRFVIRDKDGAVALMMDERTIHALKRSGDRDLIEYLARELVVPWAKGEIGHAG